MKPRSIVVNNKKYFWRVVGIDDDYGDFWFKIWQDKALVFYGHVDSRIKSITPSFIKKVILWDLNFQELASLNVKLNYVHT